ncbi:hypothetical protein O3G_MSEX004019 [Manduca sexta]|nr:hypothetical protein O3G_MSEX004019 [Manduca sexta]
MSEPQAKRLEVMFQRHKATINNRKSASWLEFQKFDQMYQPNALAVQITTYADLFIFGMSECCNAVNKGMCWAAIVEALVSPRTIMLPIVERCLTSDIPIVCMADLRRITFGHYSEFTSCVGIRRGCLREIRNAILDISNQYKAMQLQKKLALPSLMPDQKEKNEAIIANLFDVNPVEDKDKDKKKMLKSKHKEMNKPSTSGMSVFSKPSCSSTATSSKNEQNETGKEVLPPVANLKLAVNDSSENLDKKAWLNLDKEAVEMTD